MLTSRVVESIHTYTGGHKAAGLTRPLGDPPNTSKGPGEATKLVLVPVLKKTGSPSVPSPSSPSSIGQIIRSAQAIHQFTRESGFPCHTHTHTLTSWLRELDGFGGISSHAADRIPQDRLGIGTPGSGRSALPRGVRHTSPPHTVNTLRWGRGAPGLVPPPSRTFRPRVTSSSSHLLLDLVSLSRSLASASPSPLRPNSELPGGLRIRLCLRPPELLPGPHVIIPGPRAKGHLLTEGSLDQPTERWPLYPASHCSMPQPC